MGKAPKWFLIIVNKADLFFESEKLNEAQKYYHPKGNSDFSKVLQEMMSVVGTQRLQCASIPLCSFEKQLTWNNQTIKTQIGGEENRKALMANFFNTIANF